MQTLQYQGLKVIAETNHLLEDNLVVEAPLQININQESYTVVMRTPSNDFQLITGLLFAEDIYKSEESLIFHLIKEDNGVPSIININISKNLLGKGYLNKRTLLSVSSCGICGKKELKDIKVDGKKLQQVNPFSSDILHKMQLKMNSFQNTFKISGGSHAAAIFNKNHEFLTIKEDKKGKLWIETRKGLCWYNRDLDNFSSTIFNNHTPQTHRAY